MKKPNPNAKLCTANQPQPLSSTHQAFSLFSHSMIAGEIGLVNRLV